MTNERRAEVRLAEWRAKCRLCSGVDAGVAK